MTLTEKQTIAAAARTLIRLLEECDDGEFIELVLECVCENDLIPLSPRRLCGSQNQHVRIYITRFNSRMGRMSWHNDWRIFR